MCAVKLMFTIGFVAKVTMFAVLVVILTGVLMFR
jgi:hypothetical protein